MALFLFRFYPVLLPLIIYLLWLYFVRHRASKKGEPLPKFSDGSIFWLLMSSLLIAVLCILFLAVSVDKNGNKGSYQPPYMEEKKIVPAQVKP